MQPTVTPWKILIFDRAGALGELRDQAQALGFSPRLGSNSYFDDEEAIEGPFLELDSGIREGSQQCHFLAEFEAWRKHVRTCKSRSHPALILARKQELGPQNDAMAHREILKWMQSLRPSGDRPCEASTPEDAPGPEKDGLLARFSGEVAHDLNKVLTIIRGNCESLERTLGRQEASTTLIQEIRCAEAQAALLTSHLQSFQRNDAPTPKQLNLAKLIAAAAPLLRAILGDGHKLVCHFDAGPFLVKAIPGQIERVLLNLAANAREAMMDPGQFTLDLRMVESPEIPNAGFGTFVLLSARDTGVGLQESKRLFLNERMPIDKANGLGVGLSIVHNIVDQCFGFIAVDSEANQGTTFRIFLPCSRETAVESSASAERDLDAGRETILLVEDEPMVRELFRRILQNKGYFVVEAANGPEALFLVDQIEFPIHLLLTDLSMPVISGTELARRLVSVQPQLKVLFLSGFGEDALHSLGEASAWAFLPKPCSSEELLKKTREVIGNRPAVSWN